MEDLYNELIKNESIIDITSSLKHKLGFKKEDKELINETAKQAFTSFYDSFVLFPLTEEDRFYSEDIIGDLDNYLELIMYLIPCFHMLGDTLGYKNGEWEFNFGLNESEWSPNLTTEFIFQFLSLGGINDISLRNWRYSDDSILYLATLESVFHNQNNIERLGEDLKRRYVDLIPDLGTRHPGNTTMESLYMLRDGVAWNAINYNSMAIGSGTSMRTGGIGIIFCGLRNRMKLMIASIEASRITHNSAIAMLGGFTSALFTAFAIEQVPINYWPHYLLDFIRSDFIDEYLKKSRPNEYHLYQRDRVIFIGKWEKYITLRFNGLDVKKEQKSMNDPVRRINFLATNFSRIEKTYFPGACADDSVIMAYDSILSCDYSFEKAVINSVLHPGDSDTVGCIALGWFIGAFYSLKNYSIAYRLIIELEKFNHWDKVLTDMMKKQVSKIQTEMYYDTIFQKTKDLVKINARYETFDDLKQIE